MHKMLKLAEKMDKLLDETEEYIECATMMADHPKLKDAYIKLAKCHYEGYENLSECAEKVAEEKIGTHPYGDAMHEMIEWHKNKNDKRAHYLKEEMSKIG